MSLSIPFASPKASLRIVHSLALGMVLGFVARPCFAESGKVFRTARLTFLSGDVRVEQSGSSTSSKAVVNLPLVEGAVLSTGNDGQAEVEFEDGSLLRLTPHSGAGLVKLTVDSSGEYRTRVSILGGLAYAEMRGGTKFHYIVDAGGDQIEPIENATVRVNFDQPPAVISILEGSAHLTSGASDISVTAGQTVTAGDAADGGMLSLREVLAPDSWDQWNLERDAAAAGQVSSETDVRSKYAGDQGYGWSDLDANGNWYDVPGQGEVWQPDSAAQQASEDGDGDPAAQSGFDPYGYGSWAYTPAGYIWASGYGWGWLPYRCGNWNYWDGFGWGWTPAGNCGAYGFGGYFGSGIYIGRAPGFYRRPGRPIPHPGPIHPILRGRGGPVPVAPVHPIDRSVHFGSNERIIAGNVVTPIPRAGSVTPAPGFTVNSRAAIAGAGLRQDYPIDRTTNSPVIGAQGQSIYASPSSNARAAWHPVQPAAGTGQSTTVQRPGYYQPDNGVRPGAPVIRNLPIAPQRPSAPAPAPRSAPAPAPASHPTAASSHGK
jgi:hypothetical protein